MDVVENTPEPFGDLVLSRPAIDPNTKASAPLSLHIVPPGFVSGVLEHDLLTERCDCLQSSVPSDVFTTRCT